MPNEKQQAAMLAKQLRAFAERAVRDIGRGVLDEVAASTPRDTGLTAANWRASVGVPVADPVGNRSDSGVAAAQAAQDISLSVIAGYGLEDGALYVANPLPSAAALDGGSSRQEPAGFVRRGISKAVGGAAARAALGGRRGGG